jgi:CubicO group peptidase (beta-lactamase class C family)
LGREIEEWVAAGELVGAELLIVRGGETIHHAAYGWSDREAQRPLDTNSIFAIQSMSKPFTALAVLQLVEEGRLSLDDRVIEHIPGFPDERVTIENLLTHTSGFTHDGDWYRFDKPGASLRELVETWPHQTPEAPVGTFDYADFNYIHLAHLVSELTGERIEEYLVARILDPLGLDDTFTEFSSDPEWRSRLNAWYLWNDRSQSFDLRWPRDWPGWTFYSGGWGLLSTASDYAKWLMMWMDHEGPAARAVLSQDLLEEARSPQVRQDGSIWYGYGWEIEMAADEREVVSFWHGGGGGTLAIALPAQDMVIVYLTQSRGGTHRAAFWNRLYMSGLIDHPGLGLDFGPMAWAEDLGVHEVSLPSRWRAALAGQYSATDSQSGVLRNFEIWEESGRLHLRVGRPGAKAEPTFHLVPLSRDRLALGRFDGSLRAIDPVNSIRLIEEEGSPVELHLMVNGEVAAIARRLR